MTGIVKSVNIQFENHTQALLSFAQPKSPREAMESAKRATQAEYNLHNLSLEPRRRAAQYGEMAWCLYRGNQVLAWVDMNR